MSLNTISNKELIEKFLRGTLLESEKHVFNERKKEENFMKLLEETIISYQGRLELKQKLQGIGNELKTESSKTKSTSVVWISGIAASLLLLFGVYFFRGTNYSSSQLFDNYFEAYPNAYTIKGNSEDLSLSKKAFNFYDAANYKQAVDTFKKIADERSLNSSEHFYYGISLLATQKLEDAKSQFKKVNSMHPLYNEAQWYTSLSLIKQDSLVKAKKLLSETKSEFSSNRQKDVNQLLEQL